MPDQDGHSSGPVCCVREVQHTAALLSDIVSGRLGEASRAAFEDLRIEPYGTDTALIGELDLPGLRGVLDRLLAIRLELVELSRLADGTG